MKFDLLHWQENSPKADSKRSHKHHHCCPCLHVDVSKLLQLQTRLPKGSQTHFRSIITDEFLRVKGSNDSIYAIGDAATIEQVSLVIQLDLDLDCLTVAWDFQPLHVIKALNGLQTRQQQ